MNERLEVIMNNLLYAMTESFNKMQEEINKILAISEYTEKERNQIFLAVGSCLHYILDYAERIDIKEEDKSLLSAFRYANNSLKHCVEVKSITKQQGGFSFSIHFPLVIPKKEIVWSIVENGDKENQKRNYKKFLEGNDVLETCKRMIEILEKYEI